MIKCSKRHPADNVIKIVYDTEPQNKLEESWTFSCDIDAYKTASHIIQLKFHLSKMTPLIVDQ